MQKLDVVLGVGSAPNILGENQAPTVGGLSGLEIAPELGESTRQGTLTVPDPHYTVLMGGC